MLPGQPMEDYLVPTKRCFSFPRQPDCQKIVLFTPFSGLFHSHLIRRNLALHIPFSVFFALLQTRSSLWDIHGQYAKDTTFALPGHSHWAQLRDRLSNWAPWDLPFILTNGTQGAQNRMSAERPCPEELGKHWRPLWYHNELCYSFLSQHFAVFTCSGELGQLMSPFPSPGTFSA